MSAGPYGLPAGQLGDLWRCPDCRTLWHIGLACNYCLFWGHRPHPGQHLAGATWRTATLGQRVKAWLIEPVGGR